MEADYDPESGYHSGSIPLQEALAHLGMFKRTDDVPTRYRLENFASGLDPDEVWEAFVDSRDKNWSEHTLKYRYRSPWKKWCEFAENRGKNPLTPTDEDVEDWFSVFEWLTESTEYPHKYNPVLQSVVLEGAGAELWEERVYRRAKYDDRWEVQKDG
jgi:hypothetical protein